MIVGCSIALVVGLQTFETSPYFQFLLFSDVLLHQVVGIGFYTLKRWKLKMTSRGVLAIATLLVPLNFLAMAADSARDRRIS